MIQRSESDTDTYIDTESNTINFFVSEQCLNMQDARELEKRKYLHLVSKEKHSYGVLASSPKQVVAHVQPR